MNLQELISLLVIPPFTYLFSLGPWPVAQTPTCPEDMVDTGVGSCIDRYEWPNKKGVKPLLGVSGVAEKHDLKKGRVLDAERLCASVGKRVCELHEWRSACRGPGGSKYPFGDSIPKIKKRGEGPCNFSQVYRPVDGMKVYKRDERHMTWLDQSDPSGSREECRSASGAYDTVGNGEEWVRCPKGNRGWCLVGRFWSEAATCDRVVVGHAPNWHWITTTARCCKDLEE